MKIERLMKPGHGLYLRAVSQKEREKYGCAYCLHMTHAKCPYFKCPYAKLLNPFEDYEEYFNSSDGTISMIFREEVARNECKGASRNAGMDTSTDVVDNYYPD